MPSPWKSLKNIPSFSVDTMLLLTDGSFCATNTRVPIGTG